MGGMLQQNGASPMMQQPTDAAEPMMMWGDEQADKPDSWYL